MRKLMATFALLTLVACSRATEPARTSLRARTPSPTVEPTMKAVADPFALAREQLAPDPLELARTILDAREHRLGQTLQAAYRQLVATPAWRTDVISALPNDVTADVRANVEAGVELRLLTPPKTELPPWRIVAPPPAGVLRKAYAGAEDSTGVGWEYLAAIHLVETRMGRIRGTSDAGAKGPMQFLPSTWARWGGGGDIEDPHDAIMAAARYLRASGAPADIRRALFAYNHSDHYVRAVELYAQQMRADPGAFALYHQWDVYYRTTRGDALLYVGWPSR
jgi:hypothetical protein